METTLACCGTPVEGGREPLLPDKTRPLLGAGVECPEEDWEEAEGCLTGGGATVTGEVRSFGEGSCGEEKG